MKQFILLALMSATLTGFAQDKQERKQCKGITTKNVQCKLPAKQDSDHCTIHNPDKITCAGKTVKGMQCKRAVRTKGDKCFQHAFQKD